MTVLRYKKAPNHSVAFNNFLGDFFPQLPSFYRDEVKPAVPVNIRETEKEYVLDLVAPGFTKEDFKISLDNNLLSISVEKKEEKNEENTTIVRNEYSFRSFKRSFTLDEKINTEAIAAQYVNGVLTIKLSKQEEVKPAVKQITIQ